MAGPDAAAPHPTEIKLHGKEAKNRNVFSGLGNLDIVPEATTPNQL